MSNYHNYFEYYKSSSPIKTDKGIKAKNKRGKFAKNWWATQWIKALEKLGQQNRLSRGRTYARKGQILSIEESKIKHPKNKKITNGIKAKVQGSQRKAYTVTITVNSFNDVEWEQVIENLAEQAIFSAHLLAGEMPQDIEEAFLQAGLSLFPKSKRDLSTNCSCPDYANPCKHIAAVHYILGEQFDEDPFMLFRLRGRTEEQILKALRTQRTETVWFEDDLDNNEAPLLPLPEQVADFWGSTNTLTHLKTNITPPLTDVPILKRLGQPSFLQENIISLLGPAYKNITNKAMSAAYGEANNKAEETNKS